MSVMVRRVLMRRSYDLEVFDGLDGQGRPVYAEPVSIAVRAQESTEMAVSPTGSEVRVTLVAHVDPDAQCQPREQDRLIDAHDGRRYIVVTVDRPRGFRGPVRFTRLRCRDE